MKEISPFLQQRSIEPLHEDNGIASAPIKPQTLEIKKKNPKALHAYLFHVLFLRETEMIKYLIVFSISCYYIQLFELKIKL